MKPAILFDLGNTLAAYYRPEDFQPIMEDAIAGVLHELQRRGLCNVSLEFALAAAAKENREAGDFRFIPLLERLERIFAISAGSDESLVDALHSWFLLPIFAVGRVYNDTFPVLSALRSAGHPTGIVSNSPWGSPPELWRKELGRLGLTSAVDEMVLCGDVGWRKPARVIFEHAAAKLKRTCNACIFVGDDVQWDIAGSAEVGMRPVLIDRENHHAGFEGEYINELTELLARVEVSA